MCNGCSRLCCKTWIANKTEKNAQRGKWNRPPSHPWITCMKAQKSEMTWSPAQTVIDSSSQQGSKPTILDTAPFYRVILFIAWTMLLRDVCPSVRPSHAGILSKRLNIGSNVFTFSYSHTILVSNDMTISDGDHKRGRRMQGVWKISRFSANISLYLGNDTR